MAVVLNWRWPLRREGTNSFDLVERFLLHETASGFDPGSNEVLCSSGQGVGWLVRVGVDFG